MIAIIILCLVWIMAAVYYRRQKPVSNPITINISEELANHSKKEVGNPIVINISEEMVNRSKKTDGNPIALDISEELADCTKKTVSKPNAIDISEEVVNGIISKIENGSPDKKYLDSADIKQLFNIGDKTLYRWRKNEVIPFTTMGGKIVYPKQAVLGILQQRLDNKYDTIHIKAHQKVN